MTATSRERGTPPPPRPCSPPVFPSLVPPEAAQDEPTRWERWKPPGVAVRGVQTRSSRGQWRPRPGSWLRRFRERAVDIGEGSSPSVPHGLEHGPVAAEEIPRAAAGAGHNAECWHRGGSRTKDVE